MGYKPYHTNGVSKPLGYLNNTDEERAADINEMFANKKIDDILQIREGYGSTRIMHLIDYNTKRRNPKALIGFSDVTVLLNGIHQKIGLIYLHGPLISTIEDIFREKAFKDILENTTATYQTTNAILEETLTTSPEYERHPIHEGIASEQLSGGSLTLYKALIGTPH
jgi:muramoyltetrapeptide carboxypeptidase